MYVWSIHIYHEICFLKNLSLDCDYTYLAWIWNIWNQIGPFRGYLQNANTRLERIDIPTTIDKERGGISKIMHNAKKIQPKRGIKKQPRKSKVSLETCQQWEFEI